MGENQRKCLNPFQGLVGVSTRKVAKEFAEEIESQSLSGFGRCFYRREVVLGAAWKTVSIPFRVWLMSEDHGVRR